MQDIVGNCKFLSREVLGYGFEASKSDAADEEMLEEQLKLVELLLGTSYWISEEHTAGVN